MAEVSTTIPLVNRLRTYTGIGADPNRNDTPVPRGELRCAAHDASIAAVGAGDTQVVFIDCLPPVNFAYVLASVSIAVKPASAAHANNFLNVANGYLANSDSSALATYEDYFALTSPGKSYDAFTGGALKVFQPVDLPGTVLLQRNDSDRSARVWFGMENDTANDVAYLLTFLSRFYVYDLEQAHHYGINTPILTR
jgi:hypothetical protein